MLILFMNKLNSLVTQYDAKQLAKHNKNPRFYYNHYALGQYLQRASDVAE
jgi:hypothetical protein